MITLGAPKEGHVQDAKTIDVGPEHRYTTIIIRGRERPWSEDGDEPDSPPARFDWLNGDGTLLGHSESGEKFWGTTHEEALSVARNWYSWRWSGAFSGRR